MLSPESIPFIVFLFSLLLGSFANVVIVRLPRGESVVVPRSYCRRCTALIRWFDNVPVFSWLLLRGKCRSCSEPIPAGYPIVEILTGGIGLMTYNEFGISWDFLQYFLFFYMLLIASVIDLKHMILPDELTIGGILLGFIFIPLNPNHTFADAVMGFAMGFGFLWLVAYVYWLVRKEEGMGGGDIKLIGWIGVILGWKSIPFVIICSSLGGSIAGVALALIKGKGMKHRIPFGPYLAVSAWVYLFFGKEISNWYVHFFFPILGGQ